MAATTTRRALFGQALTVVGAGAIAAAPILALAAPASAPVLGTETDWEKMRIRTREFGGKGADLAVDRARKAGFDPGDLTMVSSLFFGARKATLYFGDWTRGPYSIVIAEAVIDIRADSDLRGLI